MKTEDAQLIRHVKETTFSTEERVVYPTRRDIPKWVSWGVPLALVMLLIATGIPGVGK
jgi:hypothetical protein